MNHSLPKEPVSCAPVFFALALACSLAAAAHAQEKPLPPSAKETVDFARDIEPIFNDSCLRCHGPEKPKSHFRLNSRASALAGGDLNTNDIVPGDSAKSLLIRYAAYAVEDMQMPPVGKGAQLTSHQVGLLRAWIDQGAKWSTNPLPTSTALTLVPSVGGFDVHGNKAKFRELEGVTDGFSGGLEKFSLVQPLGPNEKLSLDGHLLVPEQDFALTLGLDKTDLGFVHAGFQQWRQFYSSDGGYDPAVRPPQFTPNGDLHVDQGRAWVDFGLDLPRWPQMALGYEFQYRSGTESTLDWDDANRKNIYPATLAVNERTHILKFDVTNDFSGWHVEDSTRVEFYTERNRGAEPGILSVGPLLDIHELFNTPDDYHHVQGMNTLMFEKPIRDGWLLSGGFYYSRLEGSDYFNLTTAIPSFSVNSVLNSRQITLSRDSEIFSASSLFTPLDYLTFSLGTQNEWAREQGFGASVPDLELSVNAPAASSVDEFKAAQEANFRFTKIPFTVVSGQARLEEESVSEYQEEDPSQFMRDTAADNRRYDFQLGLSTSPWRALEWSAQFRRQDSETHYGQLLDLYNGLYGPTNGYPAFILNRDIRSDVFETKLVWRPALWLKTTLMYDISSTDYSSKTDPAFNPTNFQQVSFGGPILDGSYDAQTYSAGVTMTPVRKLYFSGVFTYSLSRALTADHAELAIVPYRGDIYTLNATATYALDPKSSVQAAYNFSRAAYGENNAAAGVPLGLDYTRHDLSFGLTRKFNARVSASLRYAFSQYAEPSGGHANDFVAHGVFCALACKFP
jgi:mono/diheme cytochrome c family protein